jgi:hypothetical protein
LPRPHFNDRAGLDPAIAAEPPYYTANLEVTRLWARSPEYRRDCEARAAKQAALLQATGWVARRR